MLHILRQALSYSLYINKYIYIILCSRNAFQFNNHQCIYYYFIVLSFIWYTFICCWLNPLHPIGCSFLIYDPSLYSLILRSVPVIVPPWHIFAYISYGNNNTYFLATYGSQYRIAILFSKPKGFKNQLSSNLTMNFTSAHYFQCLKLNRKKNS